MAQSYERRVLVTGGCGAIGSEVINRLKYLHFNTTQFINLDALTYAGREEHIEPPYDNYIFIHGDICDADLVLGALVKYQPHYIIHFAAETHVDNSFGNSLNFTTTNVYGTHVLLECVRQYMKFENNFKMFIHMSTDEVYGSVEDTESPRTEDSLFQPSNPYAATKAGAEMICKSYERSFNLPLVIVRCNNAISKYQHREKLIPRVITSIMNFEKIPVHGEGKSKRTFIHAYDIADAMDLIIERGKIGSIYNIGTEMEYTVKDVIKIILKMMLDNTIEDITPLVEYVQDRPFQDYRYSIDSSALRQLGWTEKVSFQDAISEIILAYTKQFPPALGTSI